jgi:peptidoglycan/LPS O-acetylase OafA/YrhL
MAGTTATGGQRLPNLDVLRGLAALTVLVGHAYGLGGRKVPLFAESVVDALLMLSPVGVWLFFALSGLVIAQPFVRALVAGTDRPVTNAFAVRRAGRIYPLYWVCVGVVLLAVGSAGMGPVTLLAHLALLHNLVPDHQQAFISVTWTLTLEALFYAAIPLLAALVASRRRGRVPADVLARWITWSALASVGWMLAAGALPVEQARLSLYARGLLPSMWSAFCPGLLLAVARVASTEERDRSPVLRLIEGLRQDRRRAVVVGGVAAALAVGSFFVTPEAGRVTFLWTYDLGRVCWTIAFGVLVLRAIDAVSLPARTPAALESLGTWSYGVYLIHGALFTILLAHDGGSLIPLHHGGLGAFVVHLALLAGLTVPLAWMSWRLIEQPAIEVAHRVGRSMTATGPRPT